MVIMQGSKQGFASAEGLRHLILTFLSSATIWVFTGGFCGCFGIEMGFVGRYP